MASKYKAHFIGVGGIGISALARYFLAQNWVVSGSDVIKSPLLQELRKEGLKVKIGHKKANISDDLNIVVVSQAVPDKNPEIKEARRLGIPVLTYPQALGDLTKNYKTIAITGAHGKSTTTALVSLILKAAKFDPTVVIGTKLKEFQDRNFRMGHGQYLVIEADEYQDSFLNYSPEAILITNIDKEHLDYFKNIENIKKSFLKFIGNLNPRGILVLNKDNVPLSDMKKKIESLKPDAKIIWFSLKEKNIVKQIKKNIKISGLHNTSNALGAYKLCEALGIRPGIILGAISLYRGSWRRMEYKGKFINASVYDDYAHHPTEITATLLTIRETLPQAKIICVFQPHQLKRLKALFREFSECFNEADTLILLDVYEVMGRDSGRSRTSKMSDNINSKKLAKVISRKNKKLDVSYLPSPKNLGPFLKEKLKDSKEKSVIVMMGAGDIVNLTPSLIRPR